MRTIKDFLHGNPTMRRYYVRVEIAGRCDRQIIEQTIDGRVYSHNYGHKDELMDQLISSTFESANRIHRDRIMVEGSKDKKTTLVGKVEIGF